MLRFIFSLAVVLVLASPAPAVEEVNALLLDYYEPIDAWGPMTAEEMEREAHSWQMKHYQQALWFGEVVNRLQSAGVPDELLRDALFNPKRWQREEGETKPAVVATSALGKTIADQERKIRKTTVVFWLIIIFLLVFLCARRRK